MVRKNHSGNSQKKQKKGEDAQMGKNVKSAFLIVTNPTQGGTKI